MRRLATLLAATALLVVPGSASAAPDTVVDFNQLADLTTVTSQYSGAGVWFGSPASFGFPTPSPNCGVASPQARTGQGVGGSVGANIACATGSVEFPDRRFGGAFEFSTERRKVTFALINRTPTQTQTASVRFYGIGGALKSFQTVTLTRNVATTVTFDAGAANNGIAGVVVNGQLDMYDTGGIYLDDIVATLDDVPPPPKFSLALVTPSIEVVEGSTGGAPVSVRRYNGSSGPVTLAVDSLPPGIDATSFSTNPVTGTDPTTLNVTAKLSFTGQRQLTVSATGGGSAGTGIGTTLVQTVNGIPAAYFSTGGRFPIRLVPGCGPQKIKDSFSIRGNFSGYTSYNFAGSIAASGLAGATTGSPVFPAGNGTYPIEYNLDPGERDGSGKFDVEVTPLFATPARITLNWLTDRLTIDRVPDGSPALPRVDGGATVSVIGSFPLNCPVKFQDAAGQEWTLRERDQIDVNGRLLDLYRLNLPATAVSGPLVALSSSGKEMARTTRIDVREFRNVYGMSQANSGSGAKGTYSWADFERTFGRDDTDACFIVCVRDPIASDYYDRFKALVGDGEGLCYGYAVMAARFRGYGTGQRPSDYQAGATRAWQIRPVTDGTAAKRDVVRWFVAQFDKSMAKARDDAAAGSAAAERTLLRDLISQQGAALISIRQGAEGHAVTAYGVQDTGDGGIKVNIYDPNYPYETAEETDANKRKGNLGRSVITIKADGSWTMGGADGWKGDNSTLRVYANIPPVDAKLPNDFSLASLLSSAGGKPATVTGIDVGGKPALTPSGEPRRGGGVSVMPVLDAARTNPFYRLEPGRAYEFKIRGAKRGGYQHGLLGKGISAKVRGGTSGGQVDRVTLRPGQASVGFETGGKGSPVTYDLARRSGKVTRVATVALSARKGGGDQAELTASALRLEHAGPATKATVTLGSVGAGMPSSVQVAPMSLSSGQRLELKPRSWSDVGAGVRYTVRSKSGRVLRRGSARLRSSAKVAIGGVRAKRSGRKLTVTGRVTKRGKAPTLIARAKVVRGGKALRSKAASLTGAKVRKGRFALPVNVGAVPRGARVEVEVVLLDQSAGLATARKRLTAR